MSVPSALADADARALGILITTPEQEELRLPEPVLGSLQAMEAHETPRCPTPKPGFSLLLSTLFPFPGMGQDSEACMRQVTHIT